LQAHLITKAIENMRATILAILLAAGAMILGLAIGLIISGIISGDISDIWSNWRALVH
jgi:MFS family permease